MANVTKPIALNETFKTTGNSPKNVADVINDNGADLITQATAIVTQLQALINAVKPTAAEIPLAPITGMNADDVQEGISELKYTLGAKNLLSLPFGDIVDYELYNCTGTVTNNIYCKVADNTLALCGQLTIASVGRSGSTPGVKIKLPTGYTITGVLASNQAYFIGASYYSDGVRNGETTFLQINTGTNNFVRVCASENYANVVNGKTIVYTVPYLLLRLSHNS